MIPKQKNSVREYGIAAAFTTLTFIGILVVGYIQYRIKKDYWELYNHLCILQTKYGDQWSPHVNEITNRLLNREL